MDAPQAEAVALRRSASPWTLIRRAVGDRRAVAGKLARAAQTLALVVDRRELDRRLARLSRRGYCTTPPTRAQLVFGGLDMLRFVIEPAAREYYQAQGISFGFHQLLRVLDDPVSMIDPTGLLSARDTIIGHVMQVVHLNPVYDLQLLEMFDDGLDELERQAAAMVDGTHPRAGTIGAIVEDPAYHGRLLAYVRRYRADPRAEPPVRTPQALRADPHFRAAERTFATLPGFLAYASRLPTSWAALARRLRTTPRFPLELAADGS